QHSQHEWKVRPPAALEVHDAHLRDGQSITKRTPAQLITTIPQHQTSAILVAQKQALSLFNDLGAHILQGSTLRSQEFGAHMPLEITMHPVRAFRGATRGAQIAKNGDYFGLLGTELDPQDEAGDGTPLVRATALVVNSRFEVVAGPHRYEELAWAPRVEPLGNGFAFFGLQPIHPSLSAVYETPLYYAAWTGPTGAFTSPILLSSAGGVMLRRLVTYDTCPAPDHDSVFVCYREPDTSGATTGKLILSNIDSSLSAAHLDIDPNVTTQGSDSVWYDHDTGTIMVYSGSTQILWSTDRFLSVGPTNNGIHPIMGDRACFFHHA